MSSTETTFQNNNVRWVDQQTGQLHYGDPPAELSPTGNTYGEDKIPIYWQAPTPGQVDPATGKYVPLSPSGSASQMMANILAAEFANWEQQFKPIELNLLNQSSMTNPEILTNAVRDAKDTTNQTYDALAGVEQRQRQSRGQMQTDASMQVSDRLRNLSRAQAVSGAENRARTQVAAQDELIAMGTVPNFNVVQQSQNAKYK